MILQQLFGLNQYFIFPIRINIMKKGSVLLVAIITTAFIYAQQPSRSETVIACISMQISRNQIIH